MRRPSHARLQRWADIAIPVGVGLLLLGIVDDTHRVGLAPALVALAVLLAVVQGASLWWRRSHPEAVMAITLAGGLGLQFLAPEGGFPYAAMFAIFSLAALRPPRVSLPALAALVAITATNFLTFSDEDVVFMMCIVIVPWALGEAARNRRAAIETEARRAVTEEQARIARELHDVIAHSVSVIVVQAGAADDVFDARPDQARAALRSIESAGRDALRELRLLLGAVRPGAEPDVARPQPGLDRLNELAEPLRAAGLEVAVLREGAAAPLPAGLDLSAYRIIQEALTNTLRHAHATRAEVTVRHGTEVLELTVIDDGTDGAVGPAAGGHGIAGMRERAAMLGGTLDAGPSPGGGYTVRASLPLEAAP